MNYVQLSTIIHFLVLEEPQGTEEMRFIDRLNDAFSFDHNIFLVEASVIEMSRFVDAAASSRTDNFVAKSVFMFHATNDKGERLNQLREIDSKSTLLIIVLDSFNSLWDGLNLRERLLNLREQYDFKIGIFMSQHLVQENDILEIFFWCYANGLSDVFIATYLPRNSTSSLASTLNVLKFNPFTEPFSEPFTTNMTRSETLTRLFLSKRPNFQQRPLHIEPVQKQDIELASIYGKLLNTSVRDNRGHIGVLIINYPIPIYFYNSKNCSHPTIIETCVIVVPAALPYAEFGSFLKIFFSTSIMIWFFVIIVTVVAVLTALRYVDRQKIEIYQSSVDIINLLLSENSFIRYRQLSRSEVALLVPFTFVGFVFTNAILSELISYVTHPYMHAEIESIEDIYNSTQTIYIPLDDDYNEYFLMDYLRDRHYVRDWDKRFRMVPKSDLYDQINMRNSSLFFISTETEAKALLEYQERMSIKTYRVPKEASNIMKTFYGHLAVHETSFPFMERVNEISSWLQSAGIFKKLNDDKLYSYMTNLKMQVTNESNTYLVSPWTAIYAGWTISGIVFVSELIWFKIYVTLRNNLSTFCLRL